MKRIIEFTFSPNGTLTRLQYGLGTLIVLWIATAIIMLPFETILTLAGDRSSFKNWVENPDAPQRVWVYFGVILYQIACLSIKRLRNMGWSTRHAAWITTCMGLAFYTSHMKMEDGTDNPVSNPLLLVFMVGWAILLLRKGRKHLVIRQKTADQI